MKREEYQDKMEALELKHSKAKEALHIEYANANNPYKKGDILQDHHQIILVDDVGYSIGVDGLCSCTYRGLKLKKNLNPMKSGEYDTMWQGNVKQKLN